MRGARPGRGLRYSEVCTHGACGADGKKEGGYIDVMASISQNVRNSKTCLAVIASFGCPIRPAPSFSRGSTRNLRGRGTRHPGRYGGVRGKNVRSTSYLIRLAFLDVWRCWGGTREATGTGIKNEEECWAFPSAEHGNSPRCTGREKIESAAGNHQRQNDLRISSRMTLRL